jgi:putative DNA primase/helicase
VLPDYEDRCTLLEVMSMVLIPQINFEKAGMFIGKTSANGKSTILRLMSKLFGSNNIVSISLQDLIYDRFMGQRLDGKFLNIYADINDKKITDLDKFKLFVSGDSITVQKKNGHPYQIIPNAKHFFSTNTLPEIQEDNNAVYRRFVIIEFPNSFEGKEDFDLFEKLTTPEELEGIMWLLIRTAQRLSRKRQFTFKQTPNEIRMRWKQQSNAVYEMVEKSTGFIIKKSDGRISRQEFHTQYAKFCTSKHYTINSPGTVTRQVEKLGYKSHKSNGVWYWPGLDVPKEKTDDSKQNSLF